MQDSDLRDADLSNANITNIHLARADLRLGGRAREKEKKSKEWILGREMDVFSFSPFLPRGAKLDWTKIQLNVRGAVVSQSEYDSIPLASKASLRLRIYGDGFDLIPEIEVNFGEVFFT